MIKIFSIIGIEGNFMNMVMGAHIKFIDSIILNNEMLKTFILFWNKNKMSILATCIQCCAGDSK